jgi:glyoxylase-like metal-dependent hydrolase (beta-lactamase superfamily II)
MDRLPIDERIAQYRFPPEPGKHYGFNLTVLLDEDGHRALLIDTAYEKQARAVLAELTAREIELAGVIVSHFHPDHVMGLKALPRVPVYGSARFDETVRHYADEGERRTFTPTDPVNDDTRFTFGRLDLAFRLAPGHSPCSMYTLIGDRFLHVADNIMTSNTGQDVLPWAAFDLIQDHIRSLQALREFGTRTLLLSHGVVLDDERAIDAAITNRVSYFRAILEGRGRISYEEATEGCTCDFLHQEWLIRKDSPAA